MLVPEHANAALVQRELDAALVPAVIGGAGSVFSTRAAGDWLMLLEALERPASSARARTAALTPLIGWDAQRLAAAGETELEQLHRLLHGWSRILSETGAAALTEAVMVGGGVAARVLARAGGERLVTDLQHTAELLHRAATEEQFGIAALTGWLRQRIAAAGREGAHGDERTRRLDSDAAAVQVLTIHRSKGLEFPVVYAPFLWEPGYIPEGVPVYFHDDGGTRGVDVALEGPAYEAHRRRYIEEERGEDLRLAYVALTRACHRAVVWWAGTFSCRDSPLGRLLFGVDAEGNVPVNGPSTPSDEEAFTRLTALAAQASDPLAVGVEWSRLEAPVVWTGAAADIGELSAARFDRRLDTRWRRTSYSAITAVAHERAVGSEPELVGIDDEPDPVETVVGGELPLAAMAAGPELGTIVHRAFERIDFGALDLEAAAGDALREAVGTRGAAALGCPLGQVAGGLAQAISTPLGGAFGSFALRDLALGDRVDELTFELPLAGGDEPRAAVGLGDIAGVLRAFIAPSDPLAGYAERLLDPMLSGVLRGYLTGSIDLAFRVVGEGGRASYGIVDYKTNWLGPPGEALSAWHYRPAALVATMHQTHYALQAILYCVALHRYLRWRAPGYLEGDLIGVSYGFLRGMTGAPGAGVFSWSPPPGLVAALSDALDGSLSLEGRI